MGLSIHYSGRFKAGASLPGMVEEVKDIAEIYKWKFHVFKDKFPEASIGKTKYDQNIYGINFTPPKCETIHLCFLSNGRMSSPSHLEFYGHSKNEKELQPLYMLSSKTQFAGIEIHKLVIHLFKYLSEKYLENFQLYDEGNYWETRDDKLLKNTFDRYTNLLESFESSLTSYPKKPGENFEDYFKRLLMQIHTKNKI